VLKDRIALQCTRGDDLCDELALQRAHRECSAFDQPHNRR
jgi:hypothetical protein